MIVEEDDRKLAMIAELFRSNSLPAARGRTQRVHVNGRGRPADLTLDDVMADSLTASPYLSAAGLMDAFGTKPSRSNDRRSTVSTGERPAFGKRAAARPASPAKQFSRVCRRTDGGGGGNRLRQ